MIQALIIVMLLAIIASLGSGLYHMVSPKGDPARMVRSLAWRVALSAALFGLILLFWRLGLLEPHGLLPR
ncbi:MAG: twin transmembrane helix small protein [Gammaproteobacteria bacterium]|nr:twin transmembrane helix small protein [Gammaproteobacteria bacterium]MCY4340292.1 twin transmembrane helix small protein [Gammaproteobacteria bacterium]